MLDQASDAAVAPRRYELHVVARDAMDVVRSVGGFLADRVWAGWDVTAFTAAPRAVDEQAMGILGVKLGELDDVLNPPSAAPVPDALLLCADLFIDDGAAWLGLERLLRSDIADVLLWGDQNVSRPGFVTVVQRECTSAAMVFKGHALATLGRRGRCNASAETRESLRIARRSTDSAIELGCLL